jgi:uncharacterized protein (DUF433 family)
MATVIRQPRLVEVSCDPEIMGGWPCVSGTRIPAETILLYIKDGASVEEIVGDYPSLPFGGVDAVRRWAEREGKL